MKKLLLSLLCSSLFLPLFASDVLVKIYADKSVRKAAFTVVMGTYRVVSDEGVQLALLEKGETLSLAAGDNGIHVFRGKENLGEFNSLNFTGEGLKAIFKITPEQRHIEERIYDDHIEVTVENAALRFINIVDLENYVAGVIQSEVLGSSDDVDFFKIQAIISRTYAMNNHLKHEKEGFHLCDGVHCQAYFSRNNTPKILNGAVESAGLVLVDGQRKMIAASFHSNSGGQTANSEDVWLRPTSYLKSVVDTFSLGMRNSSWEKEYSVDKWLSLLSKHYKYDIKNPEKRAQALSFEQKERKAVFHEGIPLKDMRRDLGLRSTFFSVTTEGERVMLRGKGYGHGVGLSQEGAIRMIREGRSVEEVLRFYYTGVELVHVDDLLAGDEE